ncbi:MAG TPA: LysM domain-containing protein, partial [Aggregatilineales bacterium]|nr:LysM domain-containing protein [Aggregatilineales bacterium]
PAPTVVPTGQPQPGATRYTVQPGDNLFRISLRFNRTMDAIMRANGIFNPNLIYVGQVLVIP